MTERDHYNEIEYTIPAKLQPGDSLAVIAPASPVNIPSSRIQQAYSFFEKHGLHIIEAPNLYASQGLSSGSIRDRVEVIESFIADPSIKAIMPF